MSTASERSLRHYHKHKSDPGFLEAQRLRQRRFRAKKDAEAKAAGSAYLREWREQNKRALKAQRVSKKYKISLEEYESIIANPCEICGKKPEETMIQCDHDHVSGKVRGPLCGPCNRVLGNAKDSVEILKHAIVYLTKHSK